MSRLICQAHPKSCALASLKAAILMPLLFLSSVSPCLVFTILLMSSLWLELISNFILKIIYDILSCPTPKRLPVILSITFFLHACSSVKQLLLILFQNYSLNLIQWIDR